MPESSANFTGWQVSTTTLYYDLISLALHNGKGVDFINLFSLYLQTFAKNEPQN
jgi:hypothetical protein